MSLSKKSKSFKKSLIFTFVFIIKVVNSAMPDSGPSMETLYENGLILYSESVLNESERLSVCSNDQDCHPYSNYIIQ